MKSVPCKRIRQLELRIAMTKASWTVRRRPPVAQRWIRHPLPSLAGVGLIALLAILLFGIAGVHAEQRQPTATELWARMPSGLLPLMATGDRRPGDAAPGDADSAEYANAVFDPGPPAQPFSMQPLSALARHRATRCLTSAIYYEAANESDDGQRAVAQVVLNRLRHPSYPDTVCDVVYQGSERASGCQFTFSCDGSMARVPALAAWARARRHAEAALHGYVHAPVGLSTHYHTLQVAPAWGLSLRKAAIIGAHIFYRWPGKAGEAPAFSARHSGDEPLPGPHPRTTTPGTTVSDPVLEGMTYPTLALSQARTVEPVRTVATDNRYVAGSLPESDIREEYRDSGQWIGK